MTNIISAKAGVKSVKTSATNLNLNVTNEDEFKNVYEGFRNGFAKTEASHKLATKKLGDTKRENLWNDLGAALAVCEVLMAPENAEWLFQALEYHDIPVVFDPDRANEFVPVLRLIMGYWPHKAKSAKETDPDPAYTWSRSVELYAKVLRAARDQKLTPQALVKRLYEDRGMSKIKKEDDKRNLKNDDAENDRIERYKAVINDDPKATIAAKDFALPAKNKPAMVALWAVVSGDGQTLEIQGLLPTTVATINAHIDRVSPSLYPEIALRQERKKTAMLEAELASRKPYEMTEGMNVVNMGPKPVEAAVESQA